MSVFVGATGGGSSELSSEVVEALRKLGMSGHNCQRDKSFDYDCSEDWETWLERYAAETTVSVSTSSSRTNLSRDDEGGFAMDLLCSATEDPYPGYLDWRAGSLMTPFVSEDNESFSGKWADLSPTMSLRAGEPAMAAGAMRDWDSDQFPDATSLGLCSPRNGWNGSSPKIPSGVSATASNQTHTKEPQSPTSGHQHGLCVFCAHFLEAPLKNAVADVLHSLSRQVLDASAEAPDQTPGQSMKPSAVASFVSLPQSPASSRHSLSSDMTNEGEQVPCHENGPDMPSFPFKGELSSLRHDAEGMSDSEWPEPEFEKRTRKRRDWTALEDRRLRALVEAFLRSLANRSATSPRKPLGPHLGSVGESSPGPVTPGLNPSSSSSSLKSRIPWTQIASQMPGRSAARCRERYRNYLDPSIRHEPFTAKEDAIILREYRKRGAAWAYIASKLFGRSENAVKNRLHSLLRRAKHSTACATAVPITTPAPTLA